jgi:hypothetical protein
MRDNTNPRENNDPREHDSAGFADQAPPSLVAIVLALLLAGFWTAAYRIYLELVAAGVLPS